MKLQGQPEGQSLLETCRARSIDLLKRNLAPGGILAATAELAGEQARLHGHIRTRRRGLRDRDGAVRRRLVAARPLRRLCIRWRNTRRRTGRLPSSWICREQEADFWYLGCIDSTLVVADRAGVARAAAAARRACGGDMPGASGSPFNGCWRRSISAFFCCSKTRPAIGPTSCRARDSFCTRMPCGTS